MVIRIDITKSATRVIFRKGEGRGKRLQVGKISTQTSASLQHKEGTFKPFTQ